MKVKKSDIKGCKTIKDILEKLKVNREVVVVAKNGVLCPEREKVKESDELEIIKVVSGG